jgi:hypothetical protein
MTSRGATVRDRPGLASREPAMTTPPVPPGWADEPEPGWSPARIPPYGPGYSRDVPGKGTLQVCHEHGQYRWSLQTDAAEATPGQDGFATGREAMRAADHWVRTAGTPGEANTRTPISPARRGGRPRAPRRRPAEGRGR